MDDLIKNLAATMIKKLDEIENETDFEVLSSVADNTLKNDAILLKEEISRLKACLEAL